MYPVSTSSDKRGHVSLDSNKANYSLYRKYLLNALMRYCPQRSQSRELPGCAALRQGVCTCRTWCAAFDGNVPRLLVMCRALRAGFYFILLGINGDKHKKEFKKGRRKKGLKRA
jgi:hypothetical protein